LPERASLMSRDELLRYYWMMFCRAPRKQTTPGAPVDLGEIGSVPEKDWIRPTPYSLATVGHNKFEEGLIQSSFS
jgi:hypothetical protein